MRSLASMALSLVIAIILPAVAAQGAEMAGEDLEVDWEPESLRLRPGEETIVRLTIRNVGDTTLWIGLMHVGIDCPGGSSAIFDPPYFKLPPAGEREVRVLVESHAKYHQEDCTSDARIDILWGQNLTETSGGAFLDGTVEGEHSIEIHVEDDFLLVDSIIVGALVAVVAVLAAVAYIGRRRRSGRGLPGDGM